MIRVFADMLRVSDRILDPITVIPLSDKLLSAKEYALFKLLTYNTLDKEEIITVLNEITDYYRRRRKHVPDTYVIQDVVDHIFQHQWGYSKYTPTVPNNYRYSGSGISLTVYHLWLQDNSCLVSVYFHEVSLRKTSYGKGAFRKAGPDVISEFEVCCVTCKARAFAMAKALVEDLETRFPGAKEIFSPDDIVKQRLTRDQLIVDDDSVMVIANYNQKTLLGTPIGWFLPSSTCRTVYSALRQSNIDYPKSRKLRRWTDELAIQITFEFKRLSHYNKCSNRNWRENECKESHASVTA